MLHFNHKLFLLRLSAARGPSDKNSYARSRPAKATYTPEQFKKPKCAIDAVFLAPHTSEPRDVPRCGALSLLQKTLHNRGDLAETAGAERKIVGFGACLPGTCLASYPLLSPIPFRIYLNLREQF